MPVANTSKLNGVLQVAALFSSVQELQQLEEVTQDSIAISLHIKQTESEQQPPGVQEELQLLKQITFRLGCPPNLRYHQLKPEQQMRPSDLQEELQQLKEVNSGLEAQLAQTLGQGSSGQANGLPGDSNPTLQAANLEVSAALSSFLTGVAQFSGAASWSMASQASATPETYSQLKVGIACDF